MYLLRDPDDPRRRLLVKLLAAGAFSSLPMGRVLADVLGVFEEGSTLTIKQNL